VKWLLFTSSKCHSTTAPPCIRFDRHVIIFELFNQPSTCLHYNELTMRKYKIEQVAGIGLVSLSEQTQFPRFDSG
jgi:hypothetical protein